MHSRLRTAVVGTTAAAALIGVVHLATNTNLFGDESLCGGLVSADQVRDAFGGSGKFTSVEDETQSGSLRYSCVVSRGNLVLGDDGATVRLVLADEPGDYPFALGDWSAGGAVLPSSDGSAGAAESRAWSLVPADCEPGRETGQQNRRWAVNVSAVASGPDQAGLLGLASQLRDGLIERAGCSVTGGAAKPAPAPASQATDPDNTCSLTGLSIARSDRREPAAVQEHISGSLPQAWFCDMVLQNPGGGSTSRTGAFAQLAVTQNKVTIAGVPPARYTELTCDGEPTFLLTDRAGYAWEDKERAEKGIAAPDVLHERFVEAVAEQQGCARP